MSESLDLKHLCEQCVTIARGAGIKILEIYNDGYNIQEKEDKSPLTDADLASHNIIVESLSSLTPGIPVLSEESEKTPYEQRRQWITYWLVDPLDGTREFIKRNGEFTVNIALVHNHESVIGVVHVPVTGTDYYAWKDGGAYKIENGLNAIPIHVKKLDDNRLIVVGSRSHVTRKMQDYMRNLGEVELLKIGSSLKFCLIAEGSADLYPRLGPTAEWDTAAAQCIVEEAGGHVVKTDMSQLEYNTSDSLLNPFFLVFGDISRNWSSYLKLELED